MRTNHFDKRKSGISLIGDLPWGSHFCQFYQTKKELVEIFVPYFRAGLENNEFCVWVTSRALGAEDVKKALRKAIPHFEKYTKRGQMQIIPSSRCHAKGENPGESIASLLDQAVSSGFDGLRLACSAFPAKNGGKVFACGADAIVKHNALAAFAYPRDRFDAIGLMEVVKNHRFALVRNAGKWEVLESSEARTVRDALKRSEEKLHSLFSNMSEGFAYHRIVLDEKGQPVDYVFLEVNEAFERLTSLSGKDIIGKKVTEVLPGIEEDPIDWIGKYGKVALTGKPLQFESYSAVLNKWYSISAFSPHKGYFAVTFNDISERKQTENALRRAKEEWELTFDSVPDMIAILDNNHRVIRVNESMAKRLGRKTEECIGLPCYEAVHGTSCPPDFCPHSRTLKDCRDHVQDIHEERLGMDLLVTTSPLFDELGKMIGSVHVARDITERKKVMEELRRRSEELAAANKELDAFSYAVSNDLRAPLRSIEGFATAIIEDCYSSLDNTAKDYFNRVVSASRRMSQLIDAMLNMARLTRGELLERTVNLSDLAEVAAYELGKKYPERLVEHVIAKDVKAKGDIDMLRIVIENLMDNAFKFTSKNPSAKIEFGVMKEELSPIGLIRPIYFVRDDGVGFNMDYAHKLFTPFNRLHSESEFPGIGIGLATVQKIISKHGGKIWAESAPEKGATFYFTLN